MVMEPLAECLSVVGDAGFIVLHGELKCVESDPAENVIFTRDLDAAPPLQRVLNL